MFSQSLGIRTFKQLSTLSHSYRPSSSVLRIPSKPKFFHSSSTFNNQKSFVNIVKIEDSKLFEPIISTSNPILKISNFTIDTRKLIPKSIRKSIFFNIQISENSPTQSTAEEEATRSKTNAQLRNAKWVLLLLSLAYGVCHLTSAHADNTPFSAPPTAVIAAHRLLSHQPIEDVKIAPLWKRILAFFVDNIVTSVVFQVGYIALIGSSMEVLIVPLSFLLNWMYDALMTTYNGGQTLGKLLLKIKTINGDLDMQDENVPLLNSTLSFLGKLLNVFLGCDVLYCLVDPKGENRALHNVISSTVVVEKPKKHNQNINSPLVNHMSMAKELWKAD